MTDLANDGETWTCRGPCAEAFEARRCPRPPDGLCPECRRRRRSAATRETLAARRAQDVPGFLAASGVPPRFQGFAGRGDWERCFARRWPEEVAAWQGEPSMVLAWGPTGCGKTGLATVLLLERGLAGRSCRWISAQGVLERLKAEFDSGIPALLDRLAAVDVLVLDDLWAGKDSLLARPSPWALDRMLLLLGERYNGCRETLVTTNAPPEVLAEILPTLASRLLSGVRLALDGPDVRLAGGER